MGFKKQTSRRVEAFSKSILAASIASCLYVPAGLAFENKAADKEASIEVIQVRGIKGSQIRALNTKRFAGSVVDSISAEDIGKLPDATIADSLQRISGVQISRSAGEGARLNVRGMPQVNTTLNGEQFLAAGSITTVQPDFADIPATMVSGMDVIKSNTASVLSGGISGTVNLKTLRGFDLDEGTTFAGLAELTQGSLGDDTDGRVSMFAGINEGSMAATINVAYQTSNLADYTLGSAGDGWFRGASEDGPGGGRFAQSPGDINGDGDVNDGYQSFQGHQSANKFTERERLGVNASFQAELNESLTVTADVFYTQMEEYQRSAAFIASNAWNGNWGWFNPTQTVTRADIHDANGGDFNTVQAADLQARRVMSHSENTYSDREALNTNLQLDFDNGGKFSGSVRYIHGSSTNDQFAGFADNYINDGSQAGATYKGAGGAEISAVNPWGYAGSPALDGNNQPVLDGMGDPIYTQVPLSINYSGGKQQWTLPTIDGEKLGSNVNRYAATSINNNGNETEASLDVVRADGKYQLDFADDIESVDFGIRYSDREVERYNWNGLAAFTNANGDDFVARWKDSASGAPVTGESYIPPISFNDPRIADDIIQISDFGGATGLGSLYFLDPEALDDPTAFNTMLYGSNIKAMNPDNTYVVSEETVSLYAQLNLSGNLGVPYTANVGFRYIETDLAITQHEVASGTEAMFNGKNYILGPGADSIDGGETTSNNNYTDFLPSANIAFELASDQILRFSYNKTLSSHNTDNLGRGLNVTRLIQPNGSFQAQTASANGNPDLKPWRSTNFDASYEWYFSDTGLLSLGLFQMDIESFIENGTVIRSDITDSDGQITNPSVPTSTILNGAGGKIEGLEFTYQQAFDFLPEAFNGLGMMFNYTYAPSESANTDWYGDILPINDNSENQANTVIYWEKDGLSVRLAHNYRSEALVGVQSIWDDGASVSRPFAHYTEATSYVDMSVSYDIDKNISIYAQGTNITEESQARYLQWEDNREKQFINEARYTVGVRIRL
ncbi:MAG: TonB-dependent receptor [Thalassotalea sp.]